MHTHRIVLKVKGRGKLKGKEGVYIPHVCKEELQMPDQKFGI